MFLKKVILLTIILLTSVPTVHAEITSQDIAGALKKDLKHPYLYFSEKDKPALLERIKNDPECKGIMTRLLAESNRLLYTPVERVIPTQGRNTRADWSEYDRDGKYENFFYSNRNNAFTLAFVYQMTGDEKYAHKAFEFADAFCDL